MESNELYPNNEWTGSYAEYLDQQMEAQYIHELVEQYREELAEGPFETLTTSSNTYPCGSEICRCHIEEAHQLAFEEDLPHKLLHLPLEGNDADAATVGEYFSLLLCTLWVEAEGFSGKRPFGESAWQYTIYKAMAKAGMIEITLDEHGHIEEFTSDERYKADDLILNAIQLAYNHEN